MCHQVLSMSREEWHKSLHPLKNESLLTALADCFELVHTAHISPSRTISRFRAWRPPFFHVHTNIHTLPAYTTNDPFRSLYTYLRLNHERNSNILLLLHSRASGKPPSLSLSLYISTLRERVGCLSVVRRVSILPRLYRTTRTWDSCKANLCNWLTLALYIYNYASNTSWDVIAQAWTMQLTLLRSNPFSEKLLLLHL